MQLLQYFTKRVRSACQGGLIPGIPNRRSKKKTRYCYAAADSLLVLRSTCGCSVSDRDLTAGTRVKAIRVKKNNVGNLTAVFVAGDVLHIKSVRSPQHICAFFSMELLL